MTPEMTTTILIVEDNADIRALIREALEREGYRCETAENGRAALERLRAGPLPTLILLDLMLPVVSGWEVIETLRSNPRAAVAAVPIVITSAAGETAREASWRVDGYLKKPLELDDLLAQADRFCRAPC